MSWHRIIKLPKKENFFFHFTIESYDNMGLITTLAKKEQNLTLECSTPLNNAKFFDKIIDQILGEIRNMDK